MFVAVGQNNQPIAYGETLAKLLDVLNEQLVQVAVSIVFITIEQFRAIFG